MSPVHTTPAVGDMGMDATLEHQGWSADLFRRTYRLSLLAGTVLSLAIGGLDHWPAALGLFAGTLLSVLSLASVELTVRTLFTSAEMAGTKIAIAMMLKYPLLLGGLLCIAWGAHSHRLNIFTTIAGVVLVHSVLLGLMLNRWWGQRGDPRPDGG